MFIALMFQQHMLEQAMSIFTFMGDHLLQQDDSHTFQVITNTLNTLIPAIIQVCFVLLKPWPMCMYLLFALFSEPKRREGQSADAPPHHRHSAGVRQCASRHSQEPLSRAVRHAHGHGLSRLWVLAMPNIESAVRRVRVARHRSCKNV